MVVGGVGKGAGMVLGGGVDLFTGVGDFTKDNFNAIGEEVWSIHKFTPKKYSLIKSHDMFGHPI